ncbi:N-acetyltransferase family protein [Pseudomonas sp. K1(2024)]|uniref:N-acetyltransferase family protein n=1 Tax=Pseudomonas boreofloridensis TaxID=3064348 RepID=A0ABV4Z3H6_9PSED|nr:GNAT family N-acetyltransferase [Pseudomonas sp. K13]MDO7900512.1 GNAT family N-acetyltransferase [Pseudomonas sp. K13]
MTYRIRDATQDDAQAISSVVVAALRISNSQDYPPEVIGNVEQHFSASAIKKLIVARRVFVAQDDGQLVGTASLDGSVVRTVFVAPHVQGCGVGHRLMTHVHNTAVQNGISRLQVPSSITAEGFYARLGYQRLREVMHGAERTIVMEIRLDDTLPDQP